MSDEKWEVRRWDDVLIGRDEKSRAAAILEAYLETGLTTDEVATWILSPEDKVHSVRDCTYYTVHRVEEKPTTDELCARMEQHVELREGLRKVVDEELSRL